MKKIYNVIHIMDSFIEHADAYRSNLVAVKEYKKLLKDQYKLTREELKKAVQDGIYVNGENTINLYSSEVS